jgi:phosphatidylinositol alpha 1,6-mannosyltransferase
MRVAVVTESFLPQVNGVSNTVRHVVGRLLDTGHQALVVAPRPGPDHYRSVPVVRVRSVGLPGYRSFRVGLPDPQVESSLAAFAPDVVHLASPAVLGAQGLRVARRLGAPTVAVYQTNLSGFVRRYRAPAARAVDAWVGRIHRGADRTLVPSASSWAQLEALGVRDLHLWRRGVDTSLFGPSARNAAVHDSWTGPARPVVVGYVGRLAREKQVRRLVEVARVPGSRLVVIGDGPERGWLQHHLPDAVFTGMLRGRELAQAFASLDLFVHTGVDETFCQTVQEAQASGVPVIAPASGGPLDLVAHGLSGLLYAPDEPGALAAAVDRAVGDIALRHRLAAAGRAAVRGRSWAEVVDRLVSDHYAPLAGLDLRHTGTAA